MRAIKLILILAIILISVSAQADCKAVKWSGSNNVGSLKVRDLLSIDRDELYANLYYELSHSKDERIPGLAAKLFHYLINTENNEAKYNVVQALEWAADLDKPDAPIITVKELCTLDKKASEFKGIAEDFKNQ